MLDFVLLKPGEGTIKGVAKDHDSGAGIGGAMVKAVAGALSFSATADATGAFEMTVKPGVYDLTLTAAGYETSTRAGVKSGSLAIGLEAMMIRVKESSVADGTIGVPTDLALTLKFSVAMERASAESSISLSPATAISFSWTDDSSVEVKASGLAAGTAHSLKVVAGAKAKAGGEMSKEFAVSFTTAGGLFPGGTGGALSTYFLLPLIVLIIIILVAIYLWRKRARSRSKESPAFFPTGAGESATAAKSTVTPPPGPTGAKTPAPARAGVNTLFLGSDANAAFDTVRQLAADGSRLLVLSTSMPAKLKAARKLETAEVLWITEKSGSGKVQATRLEFEIQKAVNEFFQRGPGGVLVVDGVDYLWSRAGPRTVTEFLKRCADTAAEKGGTLIGTLDPAALPAEQLAVLKRSFDKVEGDK